jgi:hypothetical protein
MTGKHGPLTHEAASPALLGDVSPVPHADASGREVETYGPEGWGFMALFRR